MKMRFWAAAFWGALVPEMSSIHEALAMDVHKGLIDGAFVGTAVASSGPRPPGLGIMSAL